MQEEFLARRCKSDRQPQMMAALACMRLMLAFILKPALTSLWCGSWALTLFVV